jgi:hypothetical protein
MRFMVIVKATKESEAGVMPTRDMLAAMGNFNEELVKAGIMQDGDGLQPSAKGARIRFSGKERTVVDGPFSETKELVAGYWIWKVKSKDEALAWAKRIPFDEGEVELRPFFEAEDFGAEFTPELRAQEERLREQAAKQNR